MGFAVFIIIVVLIFIILDNININFNYEDPKITAGKNGEIIAADIIKALLYDDDIMLMNIKISYEDKETELDNVIINKRGVFIIEVKNYSGELIGGKDDYEWLKQHKSEGGNIYSKTVKNPIKQVKRQTYILTKYLDYYGIDVWVDGYAFLLNGNAPIKSDFLLYNSKDINYAIHIKRNKKLTNKTVDKIIDLLK